MRHPTPTLRLAGALLALLAAWPASAQDWSPNDWPQYRGPKRDGVAPGPPPGAPWTASVTWRQPVGEGFSAVSAAGDSLYTLEAAAGEEHTLALAAASRV